MDVQQSLGGETFALARYDAACRAVAEAKTVDEAKDILDASIAMRVYAKQAKNKEMEADAIEIRLRAERRVGQLIAAQRETVGLANGGDAMKARGIANPEQARPTLAEAGIDKNLAKKARTAERLDDEAFEERVAAARVAVSQAVNNIIDQADKKEKRQEKEEALAAKIVALPQKRFGLIYADPEWRFEPYSRETGMDRAPENHYPTSDIETIAARGVDDIAADDCVLALWMTVPMLPQCLMVMERWGFTYKSHCIWVKDKIGTGYWFRNKHEILAIGVRGNVPAPAMGTQFASIITAPLGEHSEKPEQFAELLESYFPNLPKIELNRRGPPRPGWDAWGNEAEAAE